MRRPDGGAALVLALAVLAAGACAPDARGREAGPPRPGTASRSPDRESPLDGLALGADAAAARLGTFAWEGDVTWTVEKAGVPPIRATERHRIRQAATGDFDASADIDPGGGPGSETGKHVISTGGMVYARGRWAPYRERPTDRGEGARRFRDDSFRMGADLTSLLGPALAIHPSGGTSVLGRQARRYALSLAPVATPAPGTPPAAGGKDPDTARRRAFLEGRVPTAASGELLVDSATGIPLKLSLRASFTERDDPQLKANVELTTRVTAVGHEVAAIRTPRGALPDDRKPKGVARALEAAGLRKQGPPRATERDEDAVDEP